MIKNIAFDFGGVIVDLDREEAVQAFIRLGLENAGRILDKYHQTGIFQELEEGKLSEESFRAAGTRRSAASVDGLRKRNGHP